MPFPPDKMSNWVRHNFLHGHCHLCGLLVQHDVTGVMWSVEGAIHKEQPVTNWTDCKQAQ